MSRSNADEPILFEGEIIRAMATRTSKGEELDRHGAFYDLARWRRWRIFRESDRHYRARLVAVVSGQTYAFTESAIKTTVKNVCVGISRVEVSTVGPGMVVVTLGHRWWSWPWFLYNRRLALFACSRLGYASNRWRIR